MKCIKCECEYTYQVGNLWNCPECGNEWTDLEGEESIRVFKDSNGNVLNDGDSVSVIKDLKVKGSSSVIKQGTKVKKIRLVDGDHDIDCKVEGIGPVQIKSIYVKKL